jgi:SAM-dependent methyltransferase
MTGFEPMTENNDRYWPIFFEVYESLPRQGPGNRACTAQALALCRNLPAAPEIIDFGCGVGAQTLDLATLTTGKITAVDNHAPFIWRLSAALAAQGLSPRVRAVLGDMARPPFEPGSADLIWSEGAAYSIGLENALRTWHPLLRPGGHLAFTEAVWLRPDPPKAARAFWANEYPQIADTAANLALATRCGYEVIGNFTLPGETWWDDFYTPMTARIQDLRRGYAADAAACAVLDSLQAEIDVHRHFGDWYGYAFFVLQRQ